jgi:phosphatidylserine/phosphatidylglycerophosphate/cardiolipin synthase-like enzyme
MRWLARLLVAVLACAVFALFAGCASLPPQVQRTPSATLVAAPGTPLARVAPDAAIPADRSGFWPMPVSGFALDARLSLIRHARRSLDLQYYLIGNDTIGRLVLRELRDAAARGVRVRLLVDDLYTEGLDPLLLGLAAHDNVEVRLFNPFVGGRSGSLSRLAAFAGDFRRLNHRMHNKLFIADGAMAVAGGRNLADEYFFRSREANFLDMDLLIAGALVPTLSGLFDRYWNSDLAYPLDSIVASAEPRQALRDDFEDRTAGPTDPATLPPDGADPYGAPPLSTQLAQRVFHFVVADAGAHADSPEKARTAVDPAAPGDTVTSRFMGFLAEAQQEVLLFSPYFIPGERGIQRMRELRERGVQVRVVTNAMGTSDEPLVNLSYQRYRRQMLGMGVQLYEISSSRLTHEPSLKKVLGSSRGRLHAKMAFIDRRLVLVGSMNMDPRSAYTNTEIGIGLRSPELARMILDVYRAGPEQNFRGIYQVQLKPDGSDVEWVGRDENGEEVLLDEPDVGLWDRLRLWMLHLFVPEDLL